MGHSSGVSTMNGEYKNVNEICSSHLFTYLGPVCLQNREIAKFFYFPWIVETPELCHKKWPDFHSKSSPTISVKINLKNIICNSSNSKFPGPIVLLTLPNYHIYYKKFRSSWFLHYIVEMLRKVALISDTYVHVLCL